MIENEVKSLWLVESGEMKVEVISDTCRNAMLKAVFNFVGNLSVLISAVKIPYKNKDDEMLIYTTDKIINEIDDTVSKRMNLGIEIVSEIRNGLNLDKAQFARKCKIHVETIRKIENKRMALHENILQKILIGCGISLNEFHNKLEMKYNQL